MKVFLGKVESLSLLSEKYKEAHIITLNNSIYMIPMTEKLFDEINEMNISSEISTFELLTENIERKIFEIIGNRKLAYVESEFFGGEGGHLGIMWNDQIREVLTNFEKNSVNRVLKLLGVERTKLKDEFEIIGLNKHRNTEDWVE